MSMAVCILLIAAALPATFNPAQGMNSKDNRLTYSFAFKEPMLQSLTIEGAEYTTINMPGCLSIGKQVGEPSLPAKPISLLLPPQKTISRVTVTGTPETIDIGAFDLVSKPVFPYQPEVPFGYAPLQDFTMNSAVYSSDAYYPSAQYSTYSIGYSRGYTIATINLNP
jgi:hypothetical protein